MKIERDQVEFLAGVRGSETLGSPIAVVVRNRDYLTPKVRALMDPLQRRRRSTDESTAGPRRLRRRLEISPARPAQRPRARERERDRDASLPRSDLRAVSRRSRHRDAQLCRPHRRSRSPGLDDWNQADVEASDVRCPDREAALRMIEGIDEAKSAGDTLGGQFLVRIDGMPVGVGSNRQPAQRLDGILAGALMGMQTVRAVEIGLGAEAAATPGSQAHDAFALDGDSVVRRSNRAGGIEGGMSNGEPIVLRVSVKPIPTLMKALPSVNLHRRPMRPRRSCAATFAWFRRRRSSAEAMVRLALMGPVLEKYGGDSIEETLDNLARSTQAAADLFSPKSRHERGSEAPRGARWIHGRRENLRSGVSSRANWGARSLTPTISSLVPMERSQRSLPTKAKPHSADTSERRSSTCCRTGEAGVVAFGGGALTVAENRALLKERAHRVFLRSSPEQILRRVRRSRVRRPLLGNRPTLAKIQKLYDERLAHYAEADHVVDAERLSDRAVLDDILKWLSEKNIAF